MYLSHIFQFFKKVNIKLFQTKVWFNKSSVIQNRHRRVFHVKQNQKKKLLFKSKAAGVIAE